MNQLYKVVGVSKQAVNQYSKRQVLFDKNVQNLIIEAEELRAEHPGCGVEKMYNTLKPDFIGRDSIYRFVYEFRFQDKEEKEL